MPRVKRKHRQIFTLFPKLPTEIRSLIWDFCLPQQNVVKIQMLDNDNDGRRARCYRHAVANLRRLPHIARVCREAQLAAVRRDAQRRGYVIADPSRPAPEMEQSESEPDETTEVRSAGAGAVVVAFDPMRDIIYVSTPPAPHSTELITDLTMASSTPAPLHLAILLPRPEVAVCIPTSVIQRSPRLLYDMAAQGRDSFHLALGREFVIHMPRGMAVAQGLFGHGADDTTVMVDPSRIYEFSAYELAYNVTARRWGGSGHGELRFLIARSVTGWVDKWERLRMDTLVGMARSRVEGAWTSLQPKSDVSDPSAGMPVPIPVVVFRLCVKCRHES